MKNLFQLTSFPPAFHLSAECGRAAGDDAGESSLKIALKQHQQHAPLRVSFPLALRLQRKTIPFESELLSENVRNHYTTLVSHPPEWHV